MQYGIPCSDKLYPLLDVAFYGQYDDESWFRFDKLYPFDVAIRKIKLDETDFVVESSDKSKNIKYVSWGIDSKLFVLDVMSGDVGHVGNVLFLDFDDTDNLVEVMRKIAYLKRDNLIKSNPDIVKTNNGFHVYVYETFDFRDIAKILKSEYIYPYICNKFFRTTMYLKSSVLRLSNYKKGEENRLSIVQHGYSIGYFGEQYKEFVRRCIDENI